MGSGKRRCGPSIDFVTIVMAVDRLTPWPKKMKNCLKSSFLRTLTYI